METREQGQTKVLHTLESRNIPFVLRSPIHPLILPTASMYRRRQIADASIMAIAKMSHGNRFLSGGRGIAPIVIPHQAEKLSSVLVNS